MENMEIQTEEKTEEKTEEDVWTGVWSLILVLVWLIGLGVVGLLGYTVFIRPLIVIFSKMTP